MRNIYVSKHFMNVNIGTKALVIEILCFQVATPVIAWWIFNVQPSHSIYCFGILTVSFTLCIQIRVMSTRVIFIAHDNLSLTYSHGAKLTKSFTFKKISIPILRCWKNNSSPHRCWFYCHQKSTGEISVFYKTMSGCVCGWG